MRPLFLRLLKIKMTDVFTPEKRSDIMSRIRSRGNRDTELTLAKLFRQHHITGWRRHRKVRVVGSDHSPELTVHPDFAFLKFQVAVFVDGCFWHGCPKHSKIPENNRDFWEKKLTVNKSRDRFVRRVLCKAGWKVIRIWEHDLERYPEKCIRKVCAALRL